MIDRRSFLGRAALGSLFAGTGLQEVVSGTTRTAMELGADGAFESTVRAQAYPSPTPALNDEMRALRLLLKKKNEILPPVWMDELRVPMSTKVRMYAKEMRARRDSVSWIHKKLWGEE